MKLRVFYTFACVLFTSVALMAQLCQPDPSYIDTTGVFPAPYDADVSPDGGITTAACIGQPYEFVLTAVIGDTLNLAGAPIVLDSLIIRSIDGLPSGMQFACNPGNCTVTMADTFACVVLYGIPDETNAPGIYPLSLNATVYSGFLNLELAFPNPALAPGTYDLVLNAADSCSVSNVQELENSGLGMTFAPNPVSDFGTLDIAVKEAGDYEYIIYNLVGEVVQRKQLRLSRGTSTQTVDVQNLPKGMYLHSIQNDTKRITKRLIVN